MKWIWKIQKDLFCENDESSRREFKRTEKDQKRNLRRRVTKTKGFSNCREYFPKKSSFADGMIFFHYDSMRDEYMMKLKIFFEELNFSFKKELKQETHFSIKVEFGKRNFLCRTFS